MHPQRMIISPRNMKFGSHKPFLGALPAQVLGAKKVLCGVPANDVKNRSINIMVVLSDMTVRWRWSFRKAIPSSYIDWASASLLRSSTHEIQCNPKIDIWWVPDSNNLLTGFECLDSNTVRLLLTFPEIEPYVSLDGRRFGKRVLYRSNTDLLLRDALALGADRGRPLAQGRYFVKLCVFSCVRYL